MRVDKALNNNSCKEMLAVCNGRTYAYPQKNPVSGGSLTYSQLCHAPLRRQNTELYYLTISLLQERKSKAGHTVYSGNRRMNSQEQGNR